MNITTPDELWRIERAVYGLRQSPKWWGDFRDATLRSSSWDGVEGKTRFVQSTVEGNVWKIVTESEKVVGFMIIYVDDIMLLSSKEEAEKAYTWIRQQWQCTPLQQALEDRPITFLGVDIHVGQDDQGNQGFLLGQSGYIQELMRCYTISPRLRTSPVPREWVKEMPEAEEYTQEELRAAQKVTGELLWVAQRSRADLAYMVALMGSWTVRAPRQVRKIGLRLLEYVGATQDHKLSLIPHRDCYNGIVIFSDASFAPYGSQSVTGVLVTYKGRAMLWKGKRQSLISLSTAESELIAGCEGVVLGQSAEALLGDLTEGLDIKRLRVDNLAAIVIAEGGGSQRTRHLRVRANFIKDLIDRNELIVEHCAGDIQLADILTKVLPGVRHEYLAGLIGLGPQVSDVQTSFVGVEAVQASVVEAEATQPSPVSVYRAANALVLLILLQQVLECRSEDDDFEEQEPVNFDLYVMLLLMTFSVLFIWESGKYCISRVSRNSQGDDPLVRMIRDDSEDHRLKRERRQEAVRRVIERESEGIRRRLSHDVDEGQAPVVNVQVTTSVPASSSSDPLPPPPPPYPPSSRESGGSSGLGLALFEERGASSVEGYSGSSSGTRKDCATQTDGPQGLTFEQMCGLEMITTTSKTPGALHIFPECHALRNVTSTNRRSVCKYCIQSLRQRGKVS